MKKMLLIAALALILVQVGAYTTTVTLMQPGDSGKMLLPNGWNLNTGEQGEKINLALALNKQGCYSSGYYLFQHERECLLWLSIPVYANKSDYLEGTPTRLIGTLKVYGGVKRVSVKKIFSGNNQWIEFFADKSTNSGQYAYKPRKTSSRHYSYLTTSSYSPSRTTTVSYTGYSRSSYNLSRVSTIYNGYSRPSYNPKGAVNRAGAGYYTPNRATAGYAGYARARNAGHYTSANIVKRASYSRARSQVTIMHYSSHYSAGNQTTPKHYSSPGKANVYSRYYRRTGYYSLR